MTIIGTGRALLVAAIAMAVSAPAFACSPLPPRPVPPLPAGASANDSEAWSLAWSQLQRTLAQEDERARLLKQQASLFDSAAGIALMRLDREGRTSGAPPQFAYLNGQPLVVLTPVRWVRGGPLAGELQLGMGQAPPCGRVTADAAFRGRPGDVFLIYLSGETLEQAAVLEGFALERIVEPRTLALLAGQGQ